MGFYNLGADCHIFCVKSLIKRQCQFDCLFLLCIWARSWKVVTNWVSHNLPDLKAEAMLKICSRILGHSHSWQNWGFVKSRYSRYSSVSDMLDVLGWTPLSQRRQHRRLDLFCFTQLLTVPFEGVLVEAYKGTRRKHKMKFWQIGHTTTTSQYGQSIFS